MGDIMETAARKSGKPMLMMPCLALAAAAAVCALGLIGSGIGGALKPGNGAGNAVPGSAPIRALRSARIRAAGDVMVHQRQLNMALQADGSYDFHPQFAMVADTLADADYTIANLETTVGRQGNEPYSGYPMFNSPEAVLEAVRDAGVDFLTLANNHMLDRRLEGLRSTVENVERFGFDHGGAYRSQEEKDRPVVATVSGIRVGLLCYTEGTNGIEAYINREALAYSVSYLKDADFAGDVQRLREAGAEIVVALPHWGQEYRRQPEANTVALAQEMIAAGVDVVLGSHPHMVQPVEWVEVETDVGLRRGLVAYSLGNFISNQSKRYTDSGIIVEFTLQEQEDGSVTVADAAVIPTFCWRQSDLIQTLPALSYYDAPPENMSNADWQRLRQSCDDVRTLMGDMTLLTK